MDAVRPRQRILVRRKDRDLLFLRLEDQGRAVLVAMVAACRPAADPDVVIYAGAVEVYSLANTPVRTARGDSGHHSRALPSCA